MKVKSLSRIRLFVTLWTVAHQAPPSMGALTGSAWAESWSRQGQSSSLSVFSSKGEAKSSISSVLTASRVAESKLLLATPQAGKAREQVVGQGRTSLFGKPEGREDGLMPQRTTLPVRVGLLWVGAKSSMSCFPSVPLPVSRWPLEGMVKPLLPPTGGPG